MTQINEYDLHELNNAYNKITTVWNSGTNEQRVLAGQIMDDITKLIKFRNRYNAENFKLKHNALIDGAKNLFMQYAAYRRGEDITESLNTTPENKEDRRGGKREGAGRKPAIEKGIARKVSITLPEEQWAFIDSMIDGVNIKSLAHYFRMLAMPDSAE